MSATFNIILDTRRIRQKDQTYPVKLRIVYKGIPKDFQTVLHLTQEDYRKLNDKRIRDELVPVRDSMREIRTSCTVFLDKMVEFDFYSFERDYILGNKLFRERKPLVQKENHVGNISNFDFSPYHKRFPIFGHDHSVYGSLSTVFFGYIKRMITEERFGTALNLHNSYTKLIAYNGNVSFSKITKEYLLGFEKSMLAKDKSIGYVGMILRDLRTIFNQAIEDRIISREKYPFGRRKYLLPSTKNRKRAINIDEIGSLYYYETDDSNYRKALDYWFFCYYANGMNPKDMANLRYRNIDGEFFTFIRSKTAISARSNPKPVTVFINDDIRAIMDKYGNPDKSPENYIFPILERGQSAYDQHYAVRTLIVFINKRVIRVAKELGISRKVTTIVSRHSFSTQLKRSGASTEFIQESLGHTDKATTEHYLDSFENDVKKQFSETLSAFKKGKGL